MRTWQSARSGPVSQQAEFLLDDNEGLHLGRFGNIMIRQLQKLFRPSHSEPRLLLKADAQHASIKSQQKQALGQHEPAPLSETPSAGANSCGRIAP